MILTQASYLFENFKKRNAIYGILNWTSILVNCYDLFVGINYYKWTNKLIRAIDKNNVPNPYVIVSCACGALLHCGPEPEFCG